MVWLTAVCMMNGLAEDVVLTARETPLAQTVNAVEITSFVILSGMSVSRVTATQLDHSLYNAILLVSADASQE